MFSGITGTWNHPVYIIGGGPSLATIDLSTLKSKFTLGVNKAATTLCTNSLFSLDRNWIINSTQDINKFAGEKILSVIDSFRCPELNEDITFVRRERHTGLSTIPNMVYGRNSGYGALNVCYLKKAPVIILVGFDMQNNRGVQHWHGGYSWTHGTPKSTYEGWIREFESSVRQLKEAGIIVINANTDSRIECFTKQSLGDCLRVY